MAGNEATSGRILSGRRECGLEDVAVSAARAAQGFSETGIGPGDAIALILRNDIAFFEASTAAMLIGAYPVPINWHASTDEAGYILRDCRARAVVIHADLYNKLRSAIPDEMSVFIVETPQEIRSAYELDDAPSLVPAGAVCWGEWLSGSEPHSGSPAKTRDTMIYTSGTTGRPKGVRRKPMTEAYLHSAIAMACAMYGFRPGEPLVTVITGPMYHTAPNGYALLAARFAATIILQPKFDALELLRLIEQHKVTHVHLVPAMFIRLLELPENEARQYDLSSLVWVSHGAAPCPPAVKAGMIDWWGPVINEYYGSTETGGVTVQTSKDVADKPGSVGRAIAGVDIRILDSDKRPLPAGEVGDIYIRSDTGDNFNYHNNSSARAEVEVDRHVCIGDIGYLDDDQYLFLCDRRIDIINSGGVNIYTAEIEAAILEIDGVSDCAVFGIPDDYLGEAICAYVTIDPARPLPPEQVTLIVGARLGTLKAPKLVVAVDSLPRQDSGKVFKKELRAPFWAEKSDDKPSGSRQDD